jgi:gamma-glutamyltranspeptidase/glutathione hydrolase
MNEPERTLSASGRRFAIAAPHWAAARAGLAAFEAGGNAVDAALAAATTLAVVYPDMCGVGGDLFALVREPEGRTIAINASGAAPADIDIEALRAAGSTMPDRGPMTITVPGAVSGWNALARWSDLGWALAFEHAIGWARDGVPVAPSLFESLSWEREDPFADPGIRQVFAPHGPPLVRGDLLVQPALAQTLESLASEGPSALYGGDVGARLVHGIRELGSPMSLPDLRRHEVELDSPISARYRGLDVSVVPPTSPGFTLLQLLTVIERLDIDPDPFGPDVELLAEAIRATGGERDRHNADPRAARVPVTDLLEDGHIAALCDRVRAHDTDAPTSPLRGDTIALVTADGEGRAVSLVQSLASGFGSGILEPSTGVVCQNRGSQFSLDPTSPNVLAGGKRPAHTLVPVLVHREGRLAAVAGSMGGGAQPQINAGNLIRVFDLAMTPGHALDAPRYLVGGMDFPVGDRFVELEPGVPEHVRGTLTAAGYRLDELREYDGYAGHAHLIVADTDGNLQVATDPRADGEALAV